MKKISVICLVLTLCLAVIGVGYAGWFQNLYIEGTVSTGEVDIDFVGGDAVLVFTDNEYPWVNPGPSDVASISANLSQSDDPDSCYNLMTVSLSDGYPGYEGYIGFHVKNNGTVPVWLTCSITPGVGIDVGLEGDIGAGITLYPTQSASCNLTAAVTAAGTSSIGVRFDAIQYNEGGGH